MQPREKWLWSVGSKLPQNGVRWPHQVTVELRTCIQIREHTGAQKIPLKVSGHVPCANANAHFLHRVVVSPTCFHKPGRPMCLSATLDVYAYRRANIERSGRATKVRSKHPAYPGCAGLSTGHIIIRSFEHGKHNSTTSDFHAHMRPPVARATGHH